MFQFTGFPPIKLLIHLMVLGFYPEWVSPFGFSRFNWCLVHSTRLIADMHVLRRLPVPRHSPLALCSFTYLKEFRFRLVLFSILTSMIFFSYVFIYPEIFDNFYYLLFLFAIRLFYAVVNVQSSQNSLEL